MAGLDPVAVSTALTIGPVIFGPVTRLESTVIGEPVNLAAKLDKHNKKLGTRALATQDAFAIALAQGYYPKALGRRDVLVGSMMPIRYVGPRSSDRFRRGPSSSAAVASAA
jgi:class 3 adenylate cyclase